MAMCLTIGAMDTAIRQGWEGKCEAVDQGSFASPIACRLRTFAGKVSVRL